MKLCRFELKSSPGNARSGMVYSGKIYETDGANPVAVHEAADIRPLAPIPHAPSLRVFRSDYLTASGVPSEEPSFFYGNPGALAGPSQIIYVPEFATELEVLPMLAAAIVTEGYQIELEQADDYLLGLTLAILLVDRSDQRSERLIGAVGRSHDLGGVIGPVLVTPDDLEEEVLDAEFGRRHGLTTVLKVNGVERQRGNTSNMPFTFGQAIHYASQTCTLRSGDIFAFGPIVDVEDTPITVGADDEIQLAIDKIGALSLKLSNK